MRSFFLKSLLSTLGATALGLSAGHAVAIIPDTVTINLGGVTLKSGSDVSVLSSSAINPGITYQYAITGSAHGVGDHFSSIPQLSGTTIAAILDQIKAGSSAHLVGTVFDLDGVFPVGVFHQAVSGKYVGPGPLPDVKVKATLDVGILASGTAEFSLSNVQYTGPSFVVNSTDGIQFDSGAQIMVTNDDAPSVSPQADLVIVNLLSLGNGGVVHVDAGETNDVYDPSGATEDFGPVKINVSGGTKTVLALLQNDGPSPADIVLTGTADSGVTIKSIIVGGSNVKTAVTGSTGQTFTLVPSGGTLEVKVKVKGKKAGGPEKFVILTGSSVGGGSDTVKFGFKVKP